MFTFNGTNAVWELPSFFWGNDFVPTKDLFSSNILFDVAQYSSSFKTSKATKTANNERTWL